MLRYFIYIMSEGITIGDNFVVLMWLLGNLISWIRSKD